MHYELAHQASRTGLKGSLEAPGNSQEWRPPNPKDKELVWKKKDFTDGSWSFVNEIEWRSNSPLKYNKSAIKNSRVVSTYNKAKEFFDFNGK